TVRVPVRAEVSSSVIWNDIFDCKNAPLLAGNFFNHVPVCLKA
ncbi:hypothetical protein N306_03852, partial [Opisthocomus hoazin]